MGNDNTHPAPSERLETYYTVRPTSEIDTKGNEMLLALSGLFTCFLDIVEIYTKCIKKKKTTSLVFPSEHLLTNCLSSHLTLSTVCPSSL